jgi:hypothetical protein
MVAADPLSLVPASRTTRITGSFINRLEIRDVRYDISSYGNFLRQLPRRVHTNEALEAAVDAFDAAFSSPANQEGSVLRLRKYGAALKALRVCLCNPAKAITVETLCAVYLVMLVQVRVFLHLQTAFVSLSSRRRSSCRFTTPSTPAFS